DRQSCHLSEPARDLGRGRAAGEPHDHPLLHAFDCSTRDPPLLVPVSSSAIPQRQLVQHPLRDGTAVRTRQEPLLLEKAKVATYGGRRGRELPREVAHSNAAAL